MPHQRVCFFYPFWSQIGYQFRPFSSEIGYGLCTLVLNWVCFLEELGNSSSFGDKTISLLMFTPTTVYVPWQLVTHSGHALGSRSEIGYQIFYQVWNRAGKITVSGSVLHTPSQFFWKYPPELWDTKGRSLYQAFLAETVETGTENRDRSHPCFAKKT